MTVHEPTDHDGPRTVMVRFKYKLKKESDAAVVVARRGRTRRRRDCRNTSFRGAVTMFES